MNPIRSNNKNIMELTILATVEANRLDTKNTYEDSKYASIVRYSIILADLIVTIVSWDNRSI
jgi:hypothetical protein